MSKVIILGAKGRFGRAARHAFTQAGWEVTALARRWDAAASDGGTQVAGNASDAHELEKICQGHEVIVNALNPAYEDWPTALPPLTRAVISAARATGATVLIPGNVYNYGADAPEVLTEDTAWHPTTRKGRLRVEMEDSYRQSGVRCIVLRAGDFLERAHSGNWFDAQIAAKSKAGRSVYPGPLDQVHAWAYLPDMARVAVLLAEKRDHLKGFEEFGFEGYALTGQELVDSIATTLDRPQKISGLPWPLLRLLGLFMPTLREVYEMRYLWQVPHRLDGAKLRRMLPDFRPTPVDAAMKDILAG